MENDQNPAWVHTDPCTMEIDECQLAADQGIVHVNNEFFPLRNHFCSFLLVMADKEFY